jgi:hypothetical protein
MDLSVNEGTLVVSGGPGDSAETPIVIKKVPRGVSGAGAEHMLLHKWFGEPEKKWTLRRRELLQMNGTTLDVCRVALNDQSERALLRRHGARPRSRLMSLGLCRRLDKQVDEGGLQQARPLIACT